MNTQRITVICEGQSEVAYITDLQKFIEQESNGWQFPLIFLPEFVGGGAFAKINKILNQERKNNPKTRCEVWADYDLYRRDYKQTKTQYLAHLQRMDSFPKFCFAFYNFEDFYILHHPQNIIDQWKTIFSQYSPQHPTHFQTPLHGKDYLPRFQKLFPNYRKGMIPLDFISWESLRRLKANLINRAIPPPNDDDCRDFAAFLIGELENAYPENFVS